jgi:hypothetical protein
MLTNEFAARPPSSGDPSTALRSLQETSQLSSKWNGMATFIGSPRMEQTV